MERVQVAARPRHISTKGTLRRLRRDGLIPGVVYGRHKESLPVAVDGKELAGVLALPTGINTLVDLMLDGERDTVMVKSLSREVLFHDRFSHVDFLRISMDEKLAVHVPIHLTGEAKGVREGGVVQQAMREVALECLPAAIPDQIELDISDLDVGQSLTVKDLQLNGAVELVSDPGDVVVTVLAPRTAEEPAEAGVETKDEAAPADRENGEES